MLTRCLQSDDDRIAMMAAQAILDRGYGKPHQTQSIDANITEDGGRVHYYAEIPEKSAPPPRNGSLAIQWRPQGYPKAIDDKQTH